MTNGSTNGSTTDGGAWDDGWQLPVELAVMPEVWRALLDAHRIGPDGRCRGCRSQVTSGERWPCTLYRAAAHARRLATGP